MQGARDPFSIAFEALKALAERSEERPTGKLRGPMTINGTARVLRQPAAFSKVSG
jgi:hypothetical protein